jgi:hypothetical protein
MSQQDSTIQVPTKDETDQAVYAAYVAEGYVAQDGGIDRELVREAMFEVLRPNLVTRKSEVKSKAVTRGTLVRRRCPRRTPSASRPTRCWPRRSGRRSTSRCGAWPGPAPLRPSSG